MPRFLYRRVLQSMEIRVHSRLFVTRHNGCINARWILSRNSGREEFKYLHSFSVQKSHKEVRAGQYLRPMQLRIVPSVEIGVHSRIILARYKGCTNASCILPGSYGLAEFKNVNPFSVQKAHKAVRAGQYLRSLQHRIMTSLKIRLHSRLFLPRHNGCTNARWILSRSYGREEFKYINPFPVQNSHKAVRACQYICPMQLLLVPSMEIGIHSRLILSRYKG